MGRGPYRITVCLKVLKCPLCLVPWCFPWPVNSVAILCEGIWLSFCNWYFPTRARSPPFPHTLSFHDPLPGFLTGAPSPPCSVLPLTGLPGSQAHSGLCGSLETPEGATPPHNHPWILCPRALGTFSEPLTCVSPALDLMVLGPSKGSKWSSPQCSLFPLPFLTGDPSASQR